MRALLLVLVTVAGCGPAAEYADDVPPDAWQDCDGDVRVVAPVANLHYDAGLEVYVDVGPAAQAFGQSMVDREGRLYFYTAQSWQTDPSTGITRERFHYDLVPDERYTLSVTHCYDTQTVTFFTSSP